MEKKTKKNKSITIQRKEITAPFIVNAVLEHSDNEICSQQESILFFIKKGIKYWKEQMQIVPRGT